MPSDVNKSELITLIFATNQAWQDRCNNPTNQDEPAVICRVRYHFKMAELMTNLIRGIPRDRDAASALEAILPIIEAGGCAARKIGL